jgi:hypothetical protein
VVDRERWGTVLIDTPPRLVSQGGPMGHEVLARPVPHPGSLVLPGWRLALHPPLGKTEVVSYRWAADKQLRDAVCDFAADSRRLSAAQIRRPP